MACRGKTETSAETSAERRGPGRVRIVERLWVHKYD